MWSVAGLHDQGWRERSVFGKIRFMNYAGCKRKMNIPAFVTKYKVTKNMPGKIFHPFFRNLVDAIIKTVNYCISYDFFRFLFIYRS